MQIKSFRLEENEHEFLKKCLDWFRAQQTLVNVGAIPCIPNIFASQSQPLIMTHNTLKTHDFSDIPPIVEEVIDGGAYPDECECTKEESAILYNKQWQTLFKVYKNIKDERKRAEIKENLLNQAQDILNTK